MMSAPTLLNEKKLGFNLELEAVSNKNKKFKVNLNAETYSYLTVTATNKTDIFKQTFSNKFSVEEIKTNKYMNLYDDLKEICEQLEKITKSTPPTIKEENKSLLIIIPLPNDKYKEYTFELKEIEKNEGDKMKDITEIVYEIKKENESLKKENESLKKEISEIKNECNKLKNLTDTQNNEIAKIKEQMTMLLDYHNKIKKEKEEEEEKKLLKIESSIIKENNEYKKALKNWINSNKKIEAQLLYKKSRDGDQISKFHELCDNKGPTLTIFKTEDGNIGGIYTPLSWDDHTGWKNDLDTFMFNLNKSEKYKKLKNECSIYLSKNHGPWSYAFGFSSTNQMNKIQHCGTNINNYYENGANILPNNTNGTKYFNVSDVEVFKINEN